MSDQVSLTGTISIGPSTVNGDGSFPVGVVDIPLALRPITKPAAVNSGKVTRTLNGGGYKTLQGVGANDAVTKATFLYIRSTNPGTLRMTFGTTPSPLVQEVPFQGLTILEFDPSKPLTLLEIDITGQIEYAVSGDS